MKNYLPWFRRPAATNGTEARRPTDVGAHLAAIRTAERGPDPGPGRLIHHFAHGNLEIRLDRDVLGWYRVTISEGSKRCYSFTILCPRGDYEALRAGFEEILQFLDQAPHPARLPHHARLKGHYYGT